VMKDVPLGFDPTAVAPPPTLSTTPAGPYTDGQQVTVHGSGFTPNAPLGLAECRSGVEPDGHTCDSRDGGLDHLFSADADGNFSRTITLHTQVQSTDSTIDCAAAGSCVLFAANRQDFGGERVAMPIEFSAGTQQPPIEVAGKGATRALAFTGAGSRTVPMTVTGIALLLAGGALVLLARRRRTAG
jgi:LPXTG-motif cell wall-anchored protein